MFTAGVPIERALADRRARVADQHGGSLHQLDVVVRRQVLEEVHVGVVLVLSQLADPARDVLRAGVGVRPEDDRGQADLPYRLHASR